VDVWLAIDDGWHQTFTTTRVGLIRRLHGGWRFALVYSDPPQPVCGATATAGTFDPTRWYCDYHWPEVPR
jgi:hypothetical protein